MMPTFRRSLIACLVLITTALFAQDQPATGTIAGTVINATTKEPLFGVSVALVGTQQGGVSKLDGQFTINRVPVGSYRMRASIVGYMTMIKTDIVVSSGKTTTVVLELNESSVLLEGVTVTPEYFPTITSEPVSVQSFSSEEIRRIPGGFEDVVRAISIVPGVAQVQAGRNDLVVRGGAPSENLFIVDNITVPNINHFATQGASGGPLSFINLDYIEDTRFSTGGFGVRYGNKLSSVLSIDMKEGRKDHIGGKLTISASQFGLNVDGPVSNDGTFLFSARRSYLDFIFKAAGFGFVPEYWDFLVKASYNVSKNDRLSVLDIAAIDDVAWFNDTQDKRYNNSTVLGSSQRENILGASWRHLFSSGYFNLTLGQTLFTYDYLQRDSLLDTIFQNSTREYETSVRADVVAEIGKTTTLTVGAEGKPVRLEGDIKLPPFVNAFGDTISTDTHPNLSGTKGGAYVEVGTTVFDALRVTLGGRMEYFSLIENKFALAPRLAATYALTRVSNVSFSVGRYHQSPSMVWLSSNPKNQALDFITCDQLVAGIDHLVRPDMKVGVEVYLKKYSSYPSSTTQRYLVQANTGAGFGGSQDGFASFGLVPLVSEGTGTAHGVEMFAQKKFSEIPCYGSTNVSWSEANYTALDGVSRPGAYDQRWLFNVGGGYIFNDAWEMSAKFRFGTGRPYTPFNPDGTQDTARYNSLRTDANHSLDVRLDRRWNFTTWSLDTYIDIQNVYNNKAVDIPRWDARNQRVADNRSIGILPSIGVSAEF